MKGDYERALEFRGLNTQQAIYAYVEYIPIYGQLGRNQEALENWHKLLEDCRAGRSKASRAGTTSGTFATKTSPS